MNTTVIQNTDTSYQDGDLTNQEAPQEQPQSDKPAWLPEKFNNAEELAKAYNELEKAYSSKTPTQQQTQEQPTQEQVEQTTGLNLDAYADEYAENGELSPETYQELASKGLPQDLVDGYINGQLAIADQQTNSAYSLVGGEQNYANMMGWASQNLPEAEINSFNNVIDGGDLNAINMAISGMFARYQANNITEPNLIDGQGKAPMPTFRSTAELVTAMNDPRYKTDEAYRKDVEDRLRNSNVFE